MKVSVVSSCSPRLSRNAGEGQPPIVCTDRLSGHQYFLIQPIETRRIRAKDLVDHL
jgi:hypothetical protein